MAFSSGIIDKILVTEDYCLVSLDTGLVVFLWSYNVQDDDAKSRIVHGQFLTLARDSFNNGHTCTITYTGSLTDALEIEL